MEGTKNLTDTDNPVTGPTEASAEADALVKDTDASEQEETKGDSETTTDSLSSISVESSPQVDATVEPPTEIESPNFLTGSPVGNDTSKQNEDDLSDTERSESSVIAMEGPQLTNITSPENPGGYPRPHNFRMLLSSFYCILSHLLETTVIRTQVFRR